MYLHFISGSASRVFITMFYGILCCTAALIQSRHEDYISVQIAYSC